MATRLNLENLKTFMAVIRCGGICRAATQLHLTQPTVTTRIRNLEESLSTPLFDRVNARLRLTKRGEVLESYAEQFLKLVELVERDVIDPEGLKGRISLGVSETIAQSWLPEFIVCLNKEYSSLEIEICVDISSNLREKLLGREIDLAFLLGPISEFTVDNIELSKFELEWYTSSNSDSNEAELFIKPIASYSKNTKPYQELKRLLYEKVGPNVQLISSSSIFTSFTLIEKGLCVAALPKDLAKDFLKKGTIKAFDPGWVPKPLTFTVSFLEGPKSHFIEQAARIALDVSNSHKINNLNNKLENIIS